MRFYCLGYHIFATLAMTFPTRSQKRNERHYRARAGKRLDVQMSAMFQHDLKVDYWERAAEQEETDRFLAYIKEMGMKWYLSEDGRTV